MKRLLLFAWNDLPATLLVLLLAPVLIPILVFRIIPALRELDSEMRRGRR